MRRRHVIAGSAMFMAGYGMGTHVYAQMNPPPMPEDLAVVAPASTEPESISALSGKWAGKWRGLAGGQQQETVLVVEKVASGGATVVYSQGDHVRFPSFFKRVEARIEPGKIEFSLPARNPVILKYEIQPDGTLKGSMESRGFTAVSILERATR